MSIRTRLLILLLALAVAPMLVVLGVGQISTRVVGKRLTERTESDLVALAKVRMLQGAEAAATLAGSEAQQLNLIVLTQAHAAAEALARAADDGAPVALAPDIYLARADFDEETRTPPGLVVTEGGQRESFDVQSFIFAPGVDPAAHEGQIRALETMINVYPALRHLNPGLIENQYTATASGIHAAFPGHGGYPSDFDPRTRPWYRIAIEYAGLKEEGTAFRQPIWGDPFVDATTGRVIIAVSLAVKLTDGSIAGVTALDIVLRNLIEHFEREPTWTTSEQLMIVSTLVEDSPSGRGIPILAQRSYDDDGGDWQHSVELQEFRFDDPEATRRIVADMRAGHSGVVRAVRDATEILCAYAPIAIGDDKPRSVLVFTVPFEDVVAIADSIHDEFWSVILTQLSSNITVALIVAAAVVFFAVRGARYVTRPVEEVATAVEQVASGDLDARAEVHRNDEIGRLASNFNTMVPKLRDRVQLRNAMDLAMEVQQALLPREAPAFPGFDIDGRSIYCDETGGDYYDFLLLHRFDGAHLAVVMGDVTGHGIAAALLMTTARAILRSRIGLTGSLAQHVSEMNAQLAADNQHGRFMTMCFLVIDRAQNDMRWVLAGHDPPILYDPHTDAFSELDDEGGGIPLGIEGDWAYRERIGPMLSEGQVLVVGTDGIWEARNEQDEMFGKDRLRDVIRVNAAKPAPDITGAIVRAIIEFRGSKPQLDDITLVVVKRVGTDA